MDHISRLRDRLEHSSTSPLTVLDLRDIAALIEVSTSGWVFPDAEQSVNGNPDNGDDGDE